MRPLLEKVNISKESVAVTEKTPGEIIPIADFPNYNKLIMNDDRRSHEALSLRTFFDDQLHHLQKLVISLSSHIQDVEQQTKEDRNIVESFVDASNSKMRAVHGYSHKLREYVLALYNHVLKVADEIPPLIDLNLGGCPRIRLLNEQFLMGFREILNFPATNF